jgi:nucleoside phosphorylase
VNGGVREATTLLFFAMVGESLPFLRAWARATGERPAKTNPFGVAWAPSYVAGGLRIQLTGMGPRNARRFATAALDAGPADIVVTSGMAGGLDPGLAIGELVFDADPGFPLVEAFGRVKARPARFCGSDRVVSTAAAKSALREATGADVVDMESAVIRELCGERGIPGATLRAISDRADEELPIDFSEVVGPDEQVRLGKLALALLRSPSRIPALVRLAATMNRVGERLAAALVEVIRASA